MNRYEVYKTREFVKDLKKMIKRGKNPEKIGKIIKLLANGEKLPVANRDHKLRDTKKYNNARECHIEPDWLLVYRYENDKLILVLVETGTHSDLFNL